MVRSVGQAAAITHTALASLAPANPSLSPSLPPYLHLPTKAMGQVLHDDAVRGGKKGEDHANKVLLRGGQFLEGGREGGGK